MTKSVKFDENGRRSEIEVQISALTTLGSVQIATWHTENRIKSMPVPGITTSGADVLRNKTFIVLISIVSWENKVLNYEINNDLNTC